MSDDGLRPAALARGGSKGPSQGPFSNGRVSDDGLRPAASRSAAASGRMTLSPSAPSARPSDERMSTSGVVVAVARAYLSWNGYGVVKPSDGGKTADLTAFWTHAPVGVPANLPETVALETLPLLPMTTLTMAMPCTLNWL